MLTIRALGRRTHAERKVVALLRGDEHALRPAPAQERLFRQLAAAATAHGLTIMPVRSPWLGMDEMTILSWLASAQRIVSVSPPPVEPVLARAVLRCAAILTDMEIRLTPLTLYGARLHGRDTTLAPTREHHRQCLPREQLP